MLCESIYIIMSYPDPGREDNEYPVDDHEDGEEAQQQEPEPDEDVDLLIHCNTKKNKMFRWDCSARKMLRKHCEKY